MRPDKFEPLGFSFNFKSLDAIKGTNVRATTSDTPREKQIVITISLNIAPAIPGTKRTGTKTLKSRPGKTRRAQPAANVPGRTRTP